MVRLLKSRIEDILENKNDLIILEPSAGEGAFIKEIIEHPCFSQNGISMQWILIIGLSLYCKKLPTRLLL